MIATKRQASCRGRDGILVAIEVIVYQYNNSLMESYSIVVLPVSGSKILVLCAYTCNSEIAA